MKNTIKEPREHLIKAPEIKTYLNITSDFDYYTKFDVDFVEKVIELERLAEIGEAIEKALENNEYCIASYKGNHLRAFKTLAELVEWAESEVMK